MLHHWEETKAAAHKLTVKGQKNDTQTWESRESAFRVKWQISVLVDTTIYKHKQVPREGAWDPMWTHKIQQILTDWSIWFNYFNRSLSTLLNFNVLSR